MSPEITNHNIPKYDNKHKNLEEEEDVGKEYCDHNFEEEENYDEDEN